MYVKDIYPLILEAFSQGKTFSFPINGTSMQPLFHHQTKVEIAKMTDIKVNDIVFYRRIDGSFVLHRVVGIFDDELVLMGDHQRVKEIGIKKSSCFAKAVAYYNAKGRKKALKGFWYRLYVFSLRFMLVRRFYIKCLH